MVANARLQSWEKEYQPWMNLVKAMAGMAPQAVSLGVCWWAVAAGNARSYDIVSYCDTQESYGYVCEATKAFTRCFPLVGCSVSLVVAGRYMLQRWLYYKMLLQGSLLDFNNYVIYTDIAVLVVVASFLCGISHFALTLTHELPSKDQANKILTEYIPACIVFFCSLRAFLQH